MKTTQFVTAGHLHVLRARDAYHPPILQALSSSVVEALPATSAMPNALSVILEESVRVRPPLASSSRCGRRRRRAAVAA